MAADETDISHAPTLAVSNSGVDVPSRPAAVDVAAMRLDASTLEERYQVRKVLGEGGMGLVRLCRDARIGRDVALKLIREDQVEAPEVKMRFLREARVQAQLEHPDIVPVYDLGETGDGTAYFTMKRIRGKTLEAVLDELAEGDPKTRERYSRRKLLSVLASVCLAIDYTHACGVVHRDLKPANIMLGDFGEVWVLDWGLAKVLHERADSEPPTSMRPRAKLEVDTTQSQHDGIYGTPGYMAPEQVVGLKVDRRADVYSLGTILFEVLTLEPLHQGDSSLELLSSTTELDAGAPSERRPDLDIPPELDRLCAQATQHDPELRPARARDLGDAIERFLDGDRDHALRVEAARNEAVRAQELMEAVQAGTEDKRSDAIRTVGRALALDPQNRIALETLLQLLTEPPADVPEAAQRAIAEQTEDHDRAAASGAVAIYVGTAVLYAGFVAWMGIRSYGWLALTVGGFLTAALLSWADSRDTGTRYEFGVLLATVVGIVGSSRMLGPLVLAPTFALGNTLGFALTPRKKRRLAFIAVGCLSFLAPAFAEWAGWLPHSYRFHDGVMSVMPQMHALPPTATIAALIVITVVSTIGAAMFVGDMRDALSDAEKKLQLQAWQLSQLVPAAEPSPSAAGEDAASD